jgi:hypothetical protein
MRRPPERIIDPRNVGRIIRSKRLGTVTERDLVKGQQRLGRHGEVQPFILTASLGPWYRDNVPAASGPVSMRLMHLATSSTNPAVANVIYNTGTGADFTMVNPGRVVGAAILSSTDVTAGNALAAVYVNSTTMTTITDCELNTTYTMSRVAWLGWKRGIPFAAGNTIEAVVYTPGTFTPITADMQVTLFVAWEEPN